MHYRRPIFFTFLYQYIYLQGNKNILLDDEQKNKVEFIPKRIQIIQFYESENILRKKEI